MVMALLGVPFVSEPPEFEEVIDQTRPWDELVCDLSLGKARSVAQKYDEAVVVGADTFVVFENEYIGKPADDDQARERLRSLGGKSCAIATGLAVINARLGDEFTAAVETIAHIKPLSESDVDDYIENGYHIGKASAISIEVVDRIEGERSAALGLPAGLLAEQLRSLGFNVSGRPLSSA